MNKNQAIEKIITTIKDIDEPLFLLRGRDPLASGCVHEWIKSAKENRVNKKKVEEAEAVAFKMAMYLHTKLPD